MAVKFIEPGGDADFGIGIFGNTEGSPGPSASTTVVHGFHKRSITYDHTATNSCTVRPLNVVADAGGRISVYFQFTNSFGSNAGSDPLILLSQTGNTTTIVSVRVGATASPGVISLNVGGSGTLIGNGPTLVLNKWYRVCFCWTITSTTVNQFRLYLDGTQIVTGSNVTLTNVSSADARIGNGGGDPAIILYASDFYIDNDTSLNDTGDIWVTAKRPFANGTSNGFTTQIGAGGSGYGTGHAPQVNERANSDTNGWSISTTTVQTEEYNIEGATVGDIDIAGKTIVDYMGWIRAAESTVSNTPVSHIIVNGVSTSKTLTASAAFYSQMAGSNSYPSGTGADIGMDGQYTAVAGTYSLYEAGIVVAFFPGNSMAVQPVRLASKTIGPTMAKNIFRPQLPLFIGTVSVTAAADPSNDVSFWISPSSQPRVHDGKVIISDY